MTATLKIGELFAGYGGLGLGVKAVLGGEVAWFSEFDSAPSKILAHHWPDVPNHGDITKINWSTVEPVDILTGGFPCQDVSLAGARKGLKDGTRSGLWSHFAAAIDELRPSLVVIENVRGLLSAKAGDDQEVTDDEGWTDEEIDALEAARGSTIVGDFEPGSSGVGEPERAGGSLLNAFGSVLLDLAILGFDAEWVGVRASDAGAPHQRFRVFIVATAQNPNITARDQWGFTATGEEEGGRSRADAGRSGGARTPDALIPTPRATDGPKGAVSRTATTTRRVEDGQANLAEFVLELSTADVIDRFPTPKASDGEWGTPRTSGRPIEKSTHLGTIARLLPTPSAMVANDGEQPDTWLARAAKVKAKSGANNGLPLTIATLLLPTPQAHDAIQGKTPEQVAAMRERGHGVSNLNEVAPLLPTVTVQDASNTGAASQFERNTVPLNAEVLTLARPLSPVEEYETLWGALEDQSPFWKTDKADYWPAIERWTRVMGRKAPAPTIPDGKGGRFRLNPKFTEWMMGLPLAWITGCGLTRNEALKACGNGVVWQQAALALSILLPRVNWRLAA